MNTPSFLPALMLCTSAFLFSVPVQAKPTTSGETYTYNASHFQQVCKGKSEGSPVSMALNGVIFNGTCQLMLVPANKRIASNIEDAVLTQACVGKKTNESISTTLNDQEIKGRCNLSFHSIEPTVTAPE